MKMFLIYIYIWRCFSCSWPSWPPKIVSPGSPWSRHQDINAIRQRSNHLPAAPGAMWRVNGCQGGTPQLIMTTHCCKNLSYTSLQRSFLIGTIPDFWKKSAALIQLERKLETHCVFVPILSQVEGIPIQLITKKGPPHHNQHNQQLQLCLYELSIGW